MMSDFSTSEVTRVEHLRCRDYRRRRPRRRSRRGRVEPAKTEEPAQHLLLDGIQQLVAPRDQRLQRLMPRHGGAAAAGEQAEALI